MRVPHFLASMLKEIDFDGVVDHVYLNSIKEPDKVSTFWKPTGLKPGQFKNDHSSWIAAPTVDEVTAWLIENKKLFPTVAPTYDFEGDQVQWTAGVYDIDTTSKTSILTETYEYYNSHREAVENSIHLALQLITTLNR